jgi:aminodeoxychorismate lyase
VIVFLNGKFLPEAEAFVPLTDRGFLLGDGLFETVRVANGKPFRFAQHLERLSRGADFLKIKLPFAPKEIQKCAAQLIEKNNLSNAILRLTLTRGSGARGYSIHGADKPTLAITLHPLPPGNPDDEPVQWSLITSAHKLPAGDALAAFKTTSKILNVLARTEAEDQGADEALLLNTNGEVAETAGGNIFWIHRDAVCTVPTGRGVLPGITRAVVLEICQSLGFAVNKRVIKPEHLKNAEGIFVTQSALGIIPVAAFDGRPVAPSQLVGQIAAAYSDLLQRECC